MARRWIAFVFVSVLLSIPLGSVDARAQSATAAGPHLSLKGYDPVAYFVLGRPTPGKAEFELVFDGSRYRFSSRKHMTMFKGNPDKYAPQFAGACTAGLSMGVKIEANPLFWRIVDGKLYVFSGTKIPNRMKSEPSKVIGQARKNWRKLKDQPFH